ncbi:MAG: hypothetical protein P4L83_08500 [Nevskia sp.]|nr:hypothetical protein [Nevskia sp.]
MSTELQQRAKTFLKRAVPADLGYVSGSASERFIAAYAKSGRLNLDEEMCELMEMCAAEAEGASAEQAGEAQAYLSESAGILREILKES